MEIGKILKFVVLGCGALGLVAFFMPLIHVKKANAKVSAWQVVKGLDKVSKASKEAAAMMDKAASTPIKNEKLDEMRNKAKDISKGSDTAKFIFYIPFFPAAMFVLIGVIAVIGRFGRGSAVATILMGLVGIGIWALIRAAAKDVGVEDALGSAITMLAVCYFGATTAGIVGLFKPEPKAFS